VQRRVLRSKAQGTLHYMAPEQSGRLSMSVDHRSDFYSLGVTLYHLASGALPFRGETVDDIIAAHLNEIAVPLIDRKDTRIPVCQAISDIVAKLMAKHPNDRYKSAYGINADLEICRDKLRSMQELHRHAKVAPIVASQHVTQLRRHHHRQRTPPLPTMPTTTRRPLSPTTCVCRSIAAFRSRNSASATARACCRGSAIFSTAAATSWRRFAPP
jgi:serine/threonine protein kinase